MDTYICLLRGINVGGKNIIKMETLKQCFVDMGFSGVKTYIQSGNVIFKTQGIDKIELIKIIENQLLKNFSVEIKTAVLTINELLETVKNAPENFGSQPEEFRYDVWFLLPSTTADEIMSTTRLREDVDFLYAGKNAMYSARLTEKLGKSYLAKINQMPFYKSITVRNWNTATKLLEMAHNE